jgi:hypothetical protein
MERAIERERLCDRLTAEDRRALTPIFRVHINPLVVSGEAASLMARTPSDANDHRKLIVAGCAI